MAFVDLHEIFKKKGYTNLSTFKILMPDNYQVLYSPSPVERQLDVIAKSEVILDKIVPLIKDEKFHNEKEPNILYKITGNTAYKIFKPKDKDKNFWTDENCDGCKICEKVCPANDIVMENNKPKWLNNCEQCLARCLST